MSNALKPIQTSVILKLYAKIWQNQIQGSFLDLWLNINCRRNICNHLYCENSYVSKHYLHQPLYCFVMKSAQQFWFVYYYEICKLQQASYLLHLDMSYCQTPNFTRTDNLYIRIFVCKGLIIQLTQPNKKKFPYLFKSLLSEFLR